MKKPSEEETAKRKKKDKEKWCNEDEGIEDEDG